MSCGTLLPMLTVSVHALGCVRDEIYKVAGYGVRRSNLLNGPSKREGEGLRVGRGAERKALGIYNFKT